MQRLERLHWVDGLRTVAIVLVVAHHALTGAVLQALHAIDIHGIDRLIDRTTAAGVELFFVISGIVLLRPYLRSGRAFETGRYLRRRIERLWPPYLAGLCLAALPLWLGQTTPNWYSSANLPHVDWAGFLQHIPIVMFGRDELYNGAWWSLAVEVLFYASIPLVLVAHRLLPWTPRSLGVLLAASVLLGEWLTRRVDFAIPSHTDPLYTLGVYFPCFVLGILLARVDWPASWSRAALALGLAGILAAAYVARLNHHVAYGFAWAGMVAFVSRNSRAQAWLSHPWMVWFGERSYSIFLTHFSVLYLVYYGTAWIETDRTALYFVITRAVGLPVALLMAMLLFHKVEKRFARGLVTADQVWPWQSR